MGVVFGFTFGLLDVEDEEVLQRQEDLQFEPINMQDHANCVLFVFSSCFLQIVQVYHMRVALMREAHAPECLALIQCFGYYDIVMHI